MALPTISCIVKIKQNHGEPIYSTVSWNFLKVSDNTSESFLTKIHREVWQQCKLDNFKTNTLKVHFQNVNVF